MHKMAFAHVFGPEKKNGFGPLSYKFFVCIREMSDTENIGVRLGSEGRVQLVDEVGVKKADLASR